jgi:hypothetical protein
MLNRRKERHKNRWGVDELLHEHHMEDIMNVGLGR